MTIFTTRTDEQIKNDVLEQLGFEPHLRSSHIKVEVNEGVVTMSGYVDSYLKKLKAEDTVKEVVGVKAIAEDIEIAVAPVVKKTDTEIAKAVVHALQWHSALQHEKVKVKVEDGTVILTGEVDWDYQRKSLKTAIEHLEGVRNVINLISIRKRLMPSDVSKKITAAFQRSATVDAEGVRVEVNGDFVILRGYVRSLSERKEAEIAAWKVDGVTEVDNQLEVRYSSVISQM